MARKRKAIPKLLECVKKMPELRHSVSDGEFDITKSEVVKWLIRQPDVLQFMFDTVARPGYEERLIVYNPDRGTWRGVDT